MHSGAGNFWGELCVNAIDQTLQDPVTVLAFDGLYELVWAGSGSGRVLTLQCPSLEVYSYWPAHTHAVSSLVPLPGADCCLSVAPDSAVLCNAGGVRFSGHVHQQASSQLLCACLEPGGGAAPRAALLGTSAGSVLQMDLASGKTSQVVADVMAGEGVAVMRPGLGRGLVAMGTDRGKLLLSDPRAGYKQLESSQACLAHMGGFASMDAKDGRVACCGYGLRASAPVPEPFVKLYDVRGSMMRPLTTITLPGQGGAPSCLCFHPQMPSLVLVGCSRGALWLVDTAVGATVSSWQVETGGLALTSCVLSSTGEVWALGDSCGCVRVWSEPTLPRVHAAALHLEVPLPPPQPPAVSLGEQDAYSLAVPPPLDPHAGGRRLLSDVDAHVTMSVGLAPRVMDAALLGNIKQVDFVGHLANPYAVRGERYGVATAKVAALRNKRIDMKVHHKAHADPAAQQQERCRKRLAAGGVLLPPRFHRVEIRAQSGLKFEEFDFAAHNRTRFAGLENDLPNAYANALLQVLYFSPELRECLLTQHVPEPDVEFCLACELALLFRMMVVSHGTPCQASNFLRALRQLREAAALGLLDASVGGGGTAAAGGAEAAHDVTGLREWALGRRCAALSRFLLDTLAREGNLTNRPAASGQQASQRSNIPQPAPQNAALSALLERLFGTHLRQRLQCLTGGVDEATGQRPSRVRETSIMQVDLVYPLSTSKAARIASDVWRLGFNRVPTAAAAVLGAVAGTPTAGGPPTTPPVASSPKHHPFSPTSPAPAAAPPTTPSAPAQPTASSPLPPGATSPAPAPAQGPALPAFAELLERSLEARNETRAWFDEARGYTWVRQTRVPTSLPQVLAVSCAVAELSDIEWWLPEQAHVEVAPGHVTVVDKHRLPLALRVEVCPEQDLVRVRQGAHAAELMQQAPAVLPKEGGAPVLDFCYELTAVVAHVRDADEASGSLPAQAAGGAAGGNGAAAAAAGVTSPTSGAAGQAAAGGEGAKGAAGGKVYEGHLVAMIRPPAGYWAEAAVESACTKPPVGAGAAAPSSSAAAPGTKSLAARGTTSIPGAAAAPPDAPSDGAPAPSVGSSSAADPPGPSKPRTSQDGSTVPPAAAAAAPARPATPSLMAQVAQLMFPGGAGGLGAAGGSPQERGDWLLVNDFAVSQLRAEQVLDVYGAQKLPCLVHFTRVDASTGRLASMEPPPEPPPPPRIAPVLTAHEFAQLCRAPPLQGPQAHLGPPRFQPLDMATEAPAPGMLLALDAEFVMVSAPEKTVDAKNLEVLTRQSRLSLGRVSVLRGEGPKAGKPCIDDYVRAVEPVLDHLTRYSGLMPGDLEPSTSRHHLTTMKHAYLKLRYLVDVGCVFVGHGLKKDLRIINITLPPQQVVDTVELYSRWRQRKMSLRFLASYLLGVNIQSAVHDSVEDARTALRLYEKYMQLTAAGTFQAKLDELYAWGARYGWEPVQLDESGQPVPPVAPGSAASP